ncbi:sorting nexin-16 [Phlebotomus argentipes]|uniref:sorting nexin-16 n=1 Tax=Phlebotomus argentipes TaxID=94469 RepID=UPI002893105A|nr:sorting nexin-16 [Phlebotomus argentipes]
MSLRLIRSREVNRAQRQRLSAPSKRKEEARTPQARIKRYKSFPDVSKSRPGRDFLVKSKSESCLASEEGNQIDDTRSRQLSNAKSEVCLKTISVHSTASGAVSRSYVKNVRKGGDSSTRMSFLTPPEMQCRGFADTASIRIPIIGYEVMEERARFTVFKLRVENPFTNDCWLVLRRYTDFERLNSKLKSIFPKLNLVLPRKKIFGDNFNSVFLDSRVQGLQHFVNTIMAEETLRNCQFVREFFCLDEPPTYSESMEECRAIFEAQEETIAHLKLQLRNKDALLMNLEQKLMMEINEVEKLKASLQALQEHLQMSSKDEKIPHHSRNDFVNNNARY